jgi:hypothetical protein
MLNFRLEETPFLKSDIFTFKQIKMYKEITNSNFPKKK